MLQPALASRPKAQARLEAAAAAEVAHYRNFSPSAAFPDCTGPETFPAPGSTAWRLRDLDNQLCATGRLVDELANPAQAVLFASETPGLYLAQNLAMLGQPGHLHLTLGQLVPGGSTADPFRTISRWTTSGLGEVEPVSFAASDGAVLNGYLFEPPPSGRDPVTGLSWTTATALPGVVITTGSIQGYQQLYFWAAEGLAEAGYLVLTYDVQGQGDSDTFPSGGPVGCVTALVGPAHSCPGVPFQQNYNFFQGAEDALNFFMSTPADPYQPSASVAGLNRFNPAYARLDPTRVGIAGHSLGASAVSSLAQCDPRVRAVVAWDFLSAASGACRSQFSGLPAGAPEQPHPHAPALSLNSDYFLNPEPMTSQPAPTADAKSAGFEQVESAAVDAMQISLRASTHLEYSYVPYILPASALGERVAFYFTLAWFDRYLRGNDGAFERLTSAVFDNSSDIHSIGAGTYSFAQALAHPGDPAAGNVPPVISGLSVANELSIYYPSMYRLTDPLTGSVSVCNAPALTLGHQCWTSP